MAAAAPAAQPNRNFDAILKDIFPGTSDQVINEVILMVEQQAPFDSFDVKIESMINLLTDDGAYGPEPEIPTDNNTTLDTQYRNLAMLFPDASPDFLWQFCRDREGAFDLEDAIEELNESGYNTIELDPLSVWEQLKDALPNADPSYLKKEANRLALLKQNDLDNFLENAIEKNDYPTMADYLKNKKQLDELAMYKNYFDVEQFIEIFPNPVKTFTDPERKIALDENANENDIKYGLNFLYNRYSFIRKMHIDHLFRWRHMNLVEICDRLDKLSKGMRRPRPPREEVDTKNVALLQEIAFIANKKMIKRYLKQKDEHYRFAREEARKYNLLETCQCCFDEELIPEECYFCLKSCIFCKDCVKTGVENVIGKGELRFPCFTNCDSEFSFQTLQMVLPKKMFVRLTQKIVSEEIKKANVDGLETCPFCDFAMVLPPEEKIFKCVNEDCQMESCRECRHKSHIPLRCNEIEYDEDVQRRIFIENKMTEALTRTCYSCKKTFIKSNGCNKMTCNCGAKMCYLCGAAVTDYSHFGANKCALFTDDARLNLERVVAGAQRAKQELGNVPIKFDPSANIEAFF